MKPRRKKPLGEQSWKLEKWRSRCAWCMKKLPSDTQVFGISIALRPEAFKEMNPGTVQPLLLASAGKAVPMMVVKDSSPTKLAGKDAVFQLCSVKCAQALQAALKTELGGNPA
ncbi:MAG: hypothetical protein HZA89_09210 [Verrucomicrobia bacterium]|nr:hypothetical protein [Verrucomicrobiota bacterium]